ncbi:hypothetical protein ACUYQI_000549 [Salmonella enterica subsp. enterica serovar Braenderup]
MIPFARILEYGNKAPLPASIISTYVGSQSFYALSTDKVLYSTGNNALGQLGLGDTETRNEWVQCDTGVDEVYTGMASYAVLIRKGNSIYLSGKNTLYTGNDNGTYTKFTLIIPDISTIYEYADCYIKDIQVNDNSMMVLVGRISDSNYGALYSQGKGATLGQGNNIPANYVLSLCSTAPKTIMSISASAFNCFITTVNSNILAVGNNSFKQVANTTTSTYNVYTQATLTSQNIHCGDYVVIAIRTDGIYIRGNTPNGTMSDFQRILSFNTDLVTARNMVCSYNTRGVVVVIPPEVQGLQSGLYVLGQQFDVNGVVGVVNSFRFMYSETFDKVQGGFNHYVYKNSTGFYISGANLQFLPGKDDTAALRPMILPTN